MSLQNRLTRKFGIEHPVVLAPIDYVTDARLASAASGAGGLGLLGGGYSDGPWLHEQFETATTGPIGCGFITWSLENQQYLLDQARRGAFTSVLQTTATGGLLLSISVIVLCRPANVCIGVALVLGTPFFVVFGRLSDQYGRPAIPRVRATRPSWRARGTSRPPPRRP